ncbi:MAG: alcohol dehydrogenase catalytic domain-containing protein [Bacteroidetes bacterium]|nr:alcohol dehydrogenase catalytic domain-containing protein [Bacteroidota bacterium]
MKALFFDGSLAVKEVPVPEPKEHEVLVRILYSAICNTDLEILKGYMGFHGIPGHEFVGEVVTPGRKLSGRMVVGEINCPCGDCYLCNTGRRTHCPDRSVLGIFNRNGAFADYLVLPEENLHSIPDNLAQTSAVFTEPLAAAVEIFQQVHIRPAQKVFIFGAGKLGLLIAQVFRLNGCNYQVLSRSETSAGKAESMGINAALISTLNDTDKAEVCVDCTGSPEGITIALAHLYPRGKLVLKTTVANPDMIDLNQVVINEVEIIGSRCGPFAPALRLLASGLVDPRPIITATYDFGDILQAFEFAAKPGVLKVLIRH